MSKKSCTFAKKLETVLGTRPETKTNLLMKTKEKLMHDTGAVLRNLRDKKSQEDDIRLTHNDIAEHAGLSVRYYNKMETRKTIPTIDTLMKIANAYKTTLAEICKQIEEY